MRDGRRNMDTGRRRRRGGRGGRLAAVAVAALVAAWGGPAAAGEPAPAPAPAETVPAPSDQAIGTVQRLIALREEEIDLARASLELSKAFDDSLDVNGGLAQMDGMARELRPLLAGEKPPRDRMAAFALYLFRTRGLQPIKDENVHARDLLYQLLKTREGAASPLSFLYAVLGQHLGLPLRVAAAPRHVFVRYEDRTETLNIETTDRGSIYTEAQYKERFGDPPSPPYLKGLSRREGLALLLYQQGTWLLDRRRPAEAHVCHAAAVQVMPNYPEAWLGRGTALAVVGRPRDTVACVDEALKVYPQWAKAWHMRGSALGLAGASQEAVASLDKAIELDPKMIEAWADKGIALGALGKFEESLACFDKCIELNPGNPALWFNKAAVLSRLGKHREAVECLDKILARNPQDAQVWHSKAVAHYQLEEYAEAWRCIKRVKRFGATPDPKFIDLLKERMPEPAEP